MMQTTLALSLCMALAAPAVHAAESALPPGTLAVVNGQPVARSLLDALVRARSAHGEAGDASKRRRLLDDLVTLELASQRAHKSGLADRPQTRAELELARKTLLGQRMLQQMVADMQIDDTTLQTRYRELPPDVQIDTAHILVKDEVTARDLIGQLQRGAGFAELAAKHSIDPETRQQGGALGSLPIGELAAPFVKAAQALKPGQYTREPVQTEFGWHVIRLNSQRTVERQPYETLKPALHMQIASERLQAQVAQWKKEMKLTVLKAP